MKNVEGFLPSLERYGWKALRRSPLPWQWIGVVLVGIVLLVSALSARNSLAGARRVEEVVSRAAGLGDYSKARELWNDSMMALEDKVYPERKVERRITELEEKLVRYPGNRQIYLGLADLYGQLGNTEKASEYREKARILDPNN